MREFQRDLELRRSNHSPLGDHACKSVLLRNTPESGTLFRMLIWGVLGIGNHAQSLERLCCLRSNEGERTSVVTMTPRSSI